jgi:hypothetical protein
MTALLWFSFDQNHISLLAKFKPVRTLEFGLIGNCLHKSAYDRIDQKAKLVEKLASHIGEFPGSLNRAQSEIDNECHA